MTNKVRLSPLHTIVMTTILWLGQVGMVQAHGGLVTAFPVPNEPVINPTEVRLSFGEGVVVGTSIQVVSWETLKDVHQGQTQIDPAQPTMAFVPLAPLDPGRYSVNWYAVMIDETSTEGSYEFDVVLSMPTGRPTATTGGAPQAMEIVPSPVAAPSPANSSLLNSRAGVLIALALALGLVVTLLLIFMRPQEHK
ncbi:MAG: copper resistance protein CopC [Ardenticatenales bacterium]|nr:copper resistance protein CopC [Ardenticatenales bacterium]